ncbi:MAG: hypothetical protein JWR32_1595 [Mycobacterium sp.]|jgi:hypothetical protein|nr:hypothetical protein [Mycobacterium sp.]
MPLARRGHSGWMMVDAGAGFEFCVWQGSEVCCSGAERCGYRSTAALIARCVRFMSCFNRGPRTRPRARQ